MLAGCTWLIRPSRVAARLGAIGRILPAVASRSAVAAGLAAGRRAGPRLVLAFAAGLGALALTGAFALAPVAAYAAFVAPALLAERRADRATRDAERALCVMVEWVDALVDAGRPAERAVLAVARQSTGARVLDAVLRDATAAATLGAPLFRALAAEARAVGLARLARLGDDLEEARDLGQGSRAVLRQARDELRRDVRARSLEAAAGIDAKLMLVMVLCYLPALMLVVVVPLFLGLLRGIVE